MSFLDQIQGQIKMARKKSPAKSSVEMSFDFSSLLNLKGEEIFEFFNSLSNPHEFVKSLVQDIIQNDSFAAVQVMHSTFLMHRNLILKEEIQNYFGLPIFVKLSEARLASELEICEDSRLAEAVLNISTSIKNGNDLLLSEQADFFSTFIHKLLNSNSTSEEFIHGSVKLIIILLLQPSCRRFVKPFLEDVLFISCIKTKVTNQALLNELIEVFYYQIDESTGIYYESSEEYVTDHSKKIRSIQSKLLGNTELIPIVGNCFNFIYAAPERIYQVIQQVPSHLLNEFLLLMGFDGFSRELDDSILVDAIVSNLIFRGSNLNRSVANFPTEINLNIESFIRPLTSESLSTQELFQRHQKILQTSLFNELSQHINENINSCKPVLNRDGATEFSSWTRDATEIFSSAIVKTSCPDVQKGGKYQKIELEVSISLVHLDKLTIKSWMDLKTTEAVFVCCVEATEDDQFELKKLRTVLVHSRSVSSGKVLTLKLLVDPDQYDQDSRISGFFSKLNFIVKRTSSESSDVRLLKTLTSELKYELPKFLEDAILGISHPDDSVTLINNENDEISNPLIKRNPNKSIKHQNLTLEQSDAVFNCVNSGLSICEGPFSSGCTNVLKASIEEILLESSSRIAVICRSGPAVDRIYRDLISLGLPEHQIIRLGFSSTLDHLQQKYNLLIKQYIDLINNDILTGLDCNSIYTCGEAEYIMRGIIQPRWEAFKILLDNLEQSEDSLRNCESLYPFSECLKFKLDPNGSIKKQFEEHFTTLSTIFKTSKQLSSLELLQSSSTVSKYVLGNVSRVVLMTSKYSSINSKTLSDSGFNFDTLLVDDCNLIPEIEVLMTILSQKNTLNMKRLGLFAHANGGRPQIYSEKLKLSGVSVSLFDRFLCSGFTKSIHLSPKTDSSPWNRWINKSELFDSTIFKTSLQFVNVPAVLGKGEEMPMRNYLQNLDEAEYAVALFQLLRLNNVPVKDIAIITAYKGQVDLIKEVLNNRCNWTEFYGELSELFIGTIDQSSGLNFKNVILSLVRTKSIGFLSDHSRLELAVTRSSENLIILGSKNLFGSNSNEEFFFSSLISKRESDLLLLTNGQGFKDIEEISSFVYDLSVRTIKRE